MSSSRSRAPSPERRLRDFGAPGNGPAPRSKISAARGRYAGSLAQLRESRWRIGTRRAPLRARRIVAACLIRVKPGKSQSEQQISALPPITTVERHPGSRLLPGTIAGNRCGSERGYRTRGAEAQALQRDQVERSSACCLLARKGTTSPIGAADLAQYAAQASISFRRLSNMSPRR